MSESLDKKSQLPFLFLFHGRKKDTFLISQMIKLRKSP